MENVYWTQLDIIVLLEVLFGRNGPLCTPSGYKQEKKNLRKIATCSRRRKIVGRGRPLRGLRPIEKRSVRVESPHEFAREYGA